MNIINTDLTLEHALDGMYPENQTIESHFLKPLIYFDIKIIAQTWKANKFLVISFKLDVGHGTLYKDGPALGKGGCKQAVSQLDRCLNNGE